MDWLTGPGPYSGASTPQSDFPSILPLNEATDFLAECPESSVLLGVDGKRSPLNVDLEADSPHILVSASTGAGKSAVARSVAVQRLSRGDLVVVLDIKRHSHRWAKSLAPLVHYAPDVPTIGDALVNLGREVHRRNQVVDEWTGPLEDAPVGPPITVVFEEMNATTSRLREIDRRRPQGGYRALDALGDISFMGRAVKVRLVSMAQMATYRASGGSEVIECYGTRVLINYSPKAWRYLAEDCGRPVPAPAEVGRGMVCRGTKAVETQFLWVPEEVASETVTASVPAQRLVRQLAGSRRNLPPVWRTAIGR
jgi:hypothetical protein